MRFGIQAIQLEALLPKDLTPEEGIQHLASFNQATFISKLTSFGFNPIELGADLAIFLPHLFSPSGINDLLSIKASQDISYTVHLPLWSIEPASPSLPVRKGSTQAVIDSILSTIPLEPEVYVLHATGALAAEFYQMSLPEIAKDYILRQFQTHARDSLSEILQATKIPSRKLAIETIEFPFELTLEIAEELDLSICFDTGHILVGFSGNIDLFDALDKCYPRLAEVHIHDGPWYGKDGRIGYGQDHKALGEGDLDIFRLLKYLLQNNFTGPMIFELTVEDARKSLALIREIFPDAISEFPEGA
jgi:sugar phosphate isomerase/epimerase